jgi:hypothetical protein
MSHFAQIDANNIVTKVLVIEQDMVDTGLFGEPNTFIQTSYNTKNGIHYDPVTNQPDNGTALRYRYAGIGMIYDSGNNVFTLPKPEGMHSWVYSSNTWSWKPPIDMPTDATLPNYYQWEESNTSWILITVTK